MIITSYKTTEFQRNSGVNLDPLPIDARPMSVYSGTIITTPQGQKNIKTYQFQESLSTDKIQGLRQKLEYGIVPQYCSTVLEVSFRLKFQEMAYMILSFYSQGRGIEVNYSFTMQNTDLSFSRDLFIDGQTLLMSMNMFPDSSPKEWDIVTMQYNGETLFGVIGLEDGGYNQWYRYGTFISLTELESLYGTLEKIEHDTDYGDYSSSGGYSGGSFDDSSDTIGIPGMPKLSVSSMGFVNVYKPTPMSLQGMVDELFPQVDVPNIPTGSTLADVVNSINGLIDTVANGIIQFGNKNLLDYVLDAHIIPVSPPTSTASAIKVGYKTLSISAPKVSQDYVDFNCGTLNIKEYYTNYIDYMTTIKLYLPFVGFVPLQPEYVQNGKLNVTYRFNILDGSFCAWVLSTSSKSKLSNTVVGSFSGNCCVHIPISASNYSNVISGMVNGVSNTINAGAKGNIGGMVESSENLIQATKPDVSLSNGYNATSSYSGIRVPYLIIERPVASFSANYPKEKGLPLNVTKTLKNVKGFTIASDIILDKINASNIELEMIKNLFKGGVIL